MIGTMVAGWIAKLACWRYGHPRRKRVGITSTGTEGGTFVEFRCPRCDDRVVRKAKA